jgi:hypothetical protein
MFAGLFPDNAVKRVGFHTPALLLSPAVLFQRLSVPCLASSSANRSRSRSARVGKVLASFIKVCQSPFRSPFDLAAASPPAELCDLAHMASDFARVRFKVGQRLFRSSDVRHRFEERPLTAASAICRRVVMQGH